MSPWSSSLIAIAVISGIPLGVTLLLAVRAQAIRRFLPHLTAFGAGALMGAALLHLIPEALESGQSPLRIGGGLVAGYVLFALIERLLASHDHAHAHGLELGAPEPQHALSIAPATPFLQYSHAGHSHLGHAHTQGDAPAHASAHGPDAHIKSLVPLAFAGDALHNLVDGMLIAAGFLANPTFGLLTAVAIGLHELPREVGTYGLFVHGGVHPFRAVGFNLFTALVAFAGAVATLALGSRVANFGQLIMPAAAGSYVYIAVAIGRPVLTQGGALTNHDGRRRVMWLLSGFVLMGVSSLLAHSP